ncbi:MAG: heavy metal transporter [Deltaproteobacteria bacterium RBG_13_61_14]|nr:MAG: heavy metal transporter [Deltaproteobacteria bacterium RBG_13_61_14]
MEEKTVRVPAINCGHCVAAIAREIEKLDGVESVASDAKTKKVTVRWQAPANWKAIADKLKQLGYPPAE